MRRRGGQLAREEFIYVSTMFLVPPDAGEGTARSSSGPDARMPPAKADRLAKTPQLVGMQPAARARELFELAELMSTLLRMIELGDFDTGEKAETLYIPHVRGSQ